MQQNLTTKATGVWKFTLTDIITGEKIVKEYKNLITLVGLSALANALTDNSPACSPLITHALLGTGDTPASLSDVALETETYRNAIASRTNADNIAYLTAFFSALETSGSFKEAGLAIDGTGEDILLNRVNIDIIKTTTQTLTIDITITLLNG